MEGEWKWMYLKNLLDFSNGKASPQRSDYHPYQVYCSNGVIGRTAKANAEVNTIIIGRVGSYCGSLYFCENQCWVTDNAIKANAVGENDPRFLFYLLQPLGLNNYRAGSGQPLLNQSTLGAIKVLIPASFEQKKIARILGALDDKIELNRKMNETLEAMAQALFKDWFVDFGPVRAKIEGREPYLPKKIWDLFPERFVDSELGEIPEGWSIGSVGDLAQVTGGFAYKSSDFGNEGQPVLKIKNIVGDGAVDLKDVQRISSTLAEKTSRFILKDGDVVMAMTGATIGKVGIVVARSSETPYLNQRVAKIGRKFSEENNSHLIYLAFRNDFMLNQIINSGGGSAQSNVSA